MEKIAIVYPAIAMFLLTSSMIATLGISRFRAIRRGQVSIKYYRHYTEGSQPDRLHVLGRHIQNHFEAPPLFYIAIIFLFITDTVSTFAIVTAWLYVALRCVHSWIHLGSNNVSQRFFCFGLSMITLIVLWGSLLVPLLCNV